MKLTLQIQLLPDKAQASALRKTIERFNEAATWLAGKAFERQSANKIELQKSFYLELRSKFGLSSQMAVRCIAQTCEAYKRDRRIQPRFRKHAAMPYDQRIMRFKGIDRVSLLTLTGRILVPMIMGAYQKERFTNAKGQSDLVLRGDGKWFLLTTITVPDGTPTPTTDFVGVDLGVVNIATTSDGICFTGESVERNRRKQADRKRHLQSEAARQKRKGRHPKNVRRALKRGARKESAFRRNENHIISKQLVAQAKGTNRGIALEDLKGIRDRIRFRRPQRATMNSWSFCQLRQFIVYKSQREGVSVVLVDPHNTSKGCSACGYADRANRPSQASFSCLQCGHTENADRNAARNIRARAQVMALTVAEHSCAA